MPAPDLSEAMPMPGEAELGAPMEQEVEDVHPSLHIEGEAGEKLAAAVSPGQEFSATCMVRVVAIEGGSVELEVIDFDAEGVALEEEQGQDGAQAFDSYLAEKTAGAQE